MARGRRSDASEDGRSTPRDVRVSELALGDAELVVLSYATSEGAVLDSLTQAEREVATAAAAGMSTATIARLRGTSTRTVSNQLASIFAKLAVSSRAELARRVAGG